MRVLVIDDQVRFYEAIESALATAGHSTDYAHSIESAKALVQLPKTKSSLPSYDVIICDYDLSELDEGLLVLAYLRNEAKFNNRIILHTRNPEDYFKGECSVDRYGVEYLQKPVPYSSKEIASLVEQ